MALEVYRGKRDFGVTPEPRGRKARKDGAAFVVQEHAARRLHYDFRLELDGVLKSWAVTRGPSLDPTEKRLAMEVEDHPVDYGGFEGVIPKGAYGGGAALLWDRGTWAPVGDAHAGLAKGHLEFTLAGEKLRGRWRLVRMKGKPGERRTNWLLIKDADDWARGSGAPDILEAAPLSVATGRDLAAIAGDPAGGSARKGGPTAGPKAKAPKARAAALPDFVPPQLATPAARPPAGPDWLHEIKFDGYRLQARIKGGAARLLTRGGLDWTDRFGASLAEALSALPVRAALIDGELVVEGAGGASDFAALQADLSEGRTDRFLYYAFDLLHLDGRDLRPRPLVARKAALEPLIPGDRVRFSADFADDGALVLRHACRLSLEGVVSKRRGAPYRSGRGRGWIKSKCAARQEFVIGGFTPLAAGADLVGALWLGVQEEAGLRHVGRVGAGFTRAAARDLMARLAPLVQRASPFAGTLSAAERRDVRFVRPELAAEVEFAGWTGEGRLRHAAFRSLREDKPVTEIAREDRPRRPVRLTHPDRVYWPDAGVTKADLAAHCERVWRRMAPHAAGRPLALLRCPEGIDGDRFFQKHPWKGMAKAIRAAPDPKDPGSLAIAVDDLDGLLALVQGAALEIHPWGSTLADWERPDRIVMDLDPDEGLPWSRVVGAAGEVRARLEAAGLAAFVKTTGGKGLHVVAPLRPEASWTRVKAFAKGLAAAMAADAPGEYVATVAKARRKGRILVDWLRNQRGATAVAPWSTRARPGAPVSAPVDWEELDSLVPPGFTLSTLDPRLEAPDPWADFHAAAKPLPKGSPPEG